MGYGQLARPTTDDRYPLDEVRRARAETHCRQPDQRDGYQPLRNGELECWARRQDLKAARAEANVLIATLGVETSPAR